MIGELMVRSGQLDFRHVAGAAPVRGHLASLSARLTASVTGLALGVVIGRIAVHLAVWIVAGDTANTRIIGIVTLATGQPIRLEPDVGNVELASRRDVLPRAVTLPAKSGHFFRGEFGQVLH